MHLRVQEIRQRQGLTQQQLAVRAGCSRELISAIETHRSQPPLDRLEAIAVALGVWIQDLFPPPPRPGRPCRKRAS
jgi:transcriptional regulator with XRE-family HTH domain